jgi:hypothetical protein
VIEIPLTLIAVTDEQIANFKKAADYERQRKLAEDMMKV